MENLPVLAQLMQSLAGLLHQFPLLQQLVDITIKSFLLLTLFWLLDVVATRKLNDTSRHLLWLYGLLCLAILPFIPAVIQFWHLFWPDMAGRNPAEAIFELPVYASEAAQYWAINWGVLVSAVYLGVAGLLLSRLLFAMLSLAKLRSRCVDVTDTNLQVKLLTLRSQLRISRPIALSVSRDIDSPVSYGLLRPQILLPLQARDWNDSTLTDVLLHELCHIKRLDWLTTLLAYVLACVFWINPLVWLANRRLREESENSCDTAVLHAGRSDTDYAESLLGVASSCIHARRGSPHHHKNNRTNRSSHPLVQTMLDQNTLKTRISRVLEENKMNASQLKREVKKSVVVLLLVSAGTLGALGSHQVLNAQPQPDPASRTVDAEMFPLVDVIPNYPTLAAESGIEGWVQVRFTVSADGNVAPNSIEVVESEPVDVFERSALAAAAQFKFSPRVRGGEPVDVPNVQYVFRYKLKAESAPELPQQ